jgi:predicted MFS family arabinose efflux permease
MRHPFIDLLRDGPVRTLWIGLATSALGSQLYGIGIVWLAIDIAGTDAGFVPAAGQAAVVVMSLAAGLFVDRLPPRATMIATDLARAVVTLAPVALALTVGLSLPALVISVVLLSALHSIFDPLLYAGVPRLARTPERIQATNGLIDATVRLSRFAAPVAAGALAPILPVIHLLTLNALSFLVSAWALLRLGRAIDPEKPVALPASPIARMLHGFQVARRDRMMRRILVANTVAVMAWALGVTLGIPMLAAAQRGEGAGGLALVGLLLGAYGGADLLSNLVVSAYRPRRRWRFMHAGYVLMGGGLALVPAALLVSPPLAMLAAAAAGAGGPMFFLPMSTLVQTRFAGIDLAGVLRLRISLIAGAMMLGSLIGTWLFASLGAAATVTACGLAIAAVGLSGLVWRLREVDG